MKIIFKKIAAGLTIFGVPLAFSGYFSDFFKSYIIKERLEPIIVKYWRADDLKNSAEGAAHIVKADALAKSGLRQEAAFEYKSGIEKLSIAAKQEDKVAIRNLGLLLCFGRTGYVERDSPRAKKLISDAARLGDVYAQGKQIETCRPSN